MFGDTFSDICLIFFASLLALVALSFGPAEYTVLIVLALGSLGMLSSRPAWKGIVAMLMGVTIGMIGLDPITATERLTFGNPELEEGIGLIPMLIGFLAVSEVFRQMDDSTDELSGRAINFSSKREDNRVSWLEFRGCIPVLFRSSMLGTIIGAMPGLGATVAAFIAYGEARRTSKKPEEFGKGSLEGIAAPEAANNAVSGSNLIPLLWPSSAIDFTGIHSYIRSPPVYVPPLSTLPRGFYTTGSRNFSGRPFGGPVNVFPIHRS